MEDIRGNLETYNKQDLAIEHLNLALSLYVKNENMASVIHLAGAAEEMLGKIVALHDKENSKDALFRQMRTWWQQVLNTDTPKNSVLDKTVLNAKNTVKHINGKEDLTVELDLKKQARQLLDRAVQNYHKIPGLKNTPEMLAYHQKK
ncbi:MULTISPECIES: hypothetical protein [unclassified Vibrio]|uniref:hypothetical protein n=1 Tax=unclassified Vibrio TaxID=2614977 RepID=UPI001268C956|nr:MULTISPECIES: hypothetical protein [unclassified Vibrio]MCM5508650.1 hypothetical protein [Vibrio sp. SCSIO 43169]QFT38605.1 hypothetical protein FIU99_19765 [Vibrio sp. THAF64]QGM36857.1 hypothetical protein GGC04_21465 [Vibrio sp. THAF191d]QGN72198.1 hypothetical protein GGC03_20675 [Vibrio sp. THAF191c]